MGRKAAVTSYIPKQVGIPQQAQEESSSQLEQGRRFQFVWEEHIKMNRFAVENIYRYIN